MVWDVLKPRANEGRALESGNEGRWESARVSLSLSLPPLPPLSQNLLPFLLSPPLLSPPHSPPQYQDRIIFIQKPLDDDLANQLIATTLYLDSEDNKKDLRLYINTSGGDIVPTLALHDTLRYVTSPVSTVAFGAAFGAAAFLLATGDKGRRAALPNTRIMLHHPSGTARGQASSLDNEARELMRTRNYVNRVLSSATGRSLKRIQHDFNRNCYFSAEEAVRYGIIDKILPPPRTPEEELAASIAAGRRYPKEWYAEDSPWGERPKKK